MTNQEDPRPRRAGHNGLWSVETTLPNPCSVLVPVLVLVLVLAFGADPGACAAAGAVVGCCGGAIGGNGVGDTLLSFSRRLGRRGWAPAPAQHPHKHDHEHQQPHKGLPKTSTSTRTERWCNKMRSLKLVRGQRNVMV